MIKANNPGVPRPRPMPIPMPTPFPPTTFPPPKPKKPIINYGKSTSSK